MGVNDDVKVRLLKAKTSQEEIVIQDVTPGGNRVQGTRSFPVHFPANSCELSKKQKTQKSQHNTEGEE